MTTIITFKNQEIDYFKIVFNNYQGGNFMDKIFQSGKVKPEVEEVKIFYEDEGAKIIVWYLDKNKNTLSEQCFPFCSILSTECVFKKEEEQK